MDQRGPLPSRLGAVAGDSRPGAVSLERQCFPAWIGHGLYGYQAEEIFDIGTPESYAAAAEFFASPR